MSYKAHLTTLASKTTDLSGVQKNDIVYMQDMDQYGNVRRQTTASNTVTYTLVDHRENPNKSYLTAKLTDDHCWMVQNLALYGSQTINHTYSNLQDNTTFYVPASTNNTTYFGGSGMSTYEAHMYNGTHTNGARDGSISNNSGSYYTWVAAVASSGNRVNYRNAPYSICPKNWRLPKMYENNKTNSDLTVFNNANINAGFLIANTGVCFSSDGCPNASRLKFAWWSSTFSTDYNPSAWLLTNGSADFNSGSSGRTTWYACHGLSVRCVAND